ncbi:hypothetical protein [Mycoplasma struthionis]|uniref:DUF4760 domain-containing protein n=1 Tax=Mycoplasma struthionis TaxID=538220 RepID=A0A3G8LG44_9MOLU|nr:hypothetical protein [Mycoplasma struthionis]AZG68633.1 hypothetical protein EGN60_01455 [Mycoplasma struthionis]
MDKRKKILIKNYAFETLGFLIVCLFLAISIILFLLGAKVIANLNLKAQIACYVFGSIFAIIFILIVIKIIMIYLTDNKYLKLSVDTNELFQNESLEDKYLISNEEFKKDYSRYQSSLDTLYGFLIDLERKGYKRDYIEIKSLEIRYLMQQLIMSCDDAYDNFDIFMAIDFLKATAKQKFIWKGDLKKYPIYFEYLRKIIKEANEYILENHIQSK